MSTRFRKFSPSQSKRSSWLIFFLIVCALLLEIFHDSDFYRVFYTQAAGKTYHRARTMAGQNQSISNKNALQIGKVALIEGAYPITIHAPESFNFKAKSEILEARKKLVHAHASLVKGDYQPADSVFSQIKDGAPWWGIEGEFYHGSGKGSIKGESEESRFIMNPFLLVGVECYGFSFWRGIWWDDDLVKPHLNDPDFPYYCKPAGLIWYPKESKAEVSYHITEYLSNLNAYLLTPVSITNNSFDLMAYNARDFNLNYLYISPEHSTNLIHKKRQIKPFPLGQFIHRGGSCGYPGGCNNMSPAQSTLDDVRIRNLPAAFHIKLWHNKPKSVDQPADMTFIIHFT